VSPNTDPIQNFSCRIMPQNLSDAGISWKVYRNKVLGPLVSALTVGTFVEYFTQTADPRSDLARRAVAPSYPGNFIADVKANNLPQVSWVVPNPIESEHPAFLPAAGASALVNVIRILLSNPAVWEKLS
jgi:phospholipase C